MYLCEVANEDMKWSLLREKHQKMVWRSNGSMKLKQRKMKSMKRENNKKESWKMKNEEEISISENHEAANIWAYCVNVLWNMW